MNREAQALRNQQDQAVSLQGQYFDDYSPTLEHIINWIQTALIELKETDPADLDDKIQAIGCQKLLKQLLSSLGQISTKEELSVSSFFMELPETLTLIEKDISAYMRANPDADYQLKTIFQEPGFFSVAVYRICHLLQTFDLSLIANKITSGINEKYQNYISPGCIIGEYCYIEGQNIEIGRSVKIGDHVKIFGGVKIRLSLEGREELVYQSNIDELAIEDNVMICSGVRIAGERISIGKNSIIGKNAFITSSVAPEKIVPQNKICKQFTNLQIKLDSLKNLIGNTPLVEIKTIFSKPKVKIFSKFEGANPGGSAKDRIAYFIVRQAIERGEITPNTKIIEATSGNTGIALAMIGSILNIGVQIAMAANATIERVKIMRAFGAKVVLTPTQQGLEGARNYVTKQLTKGGYFCVNQYDNPDNSLAHYQTTGRQIYSGTNGKVTHFISAMGTTGTVMGVGKFLKEKNKQIKVIGLEPADGSQVPGIRKWPSDYKPKIFNPEYLNEIVQIEQKDAEKMAVRLTREQGLFTGISSGGAFHCALSIANKIDQGCIVFLACDKGDRYLSSQIFGKE